MGTQHQLTSTRPTLILKICALSMLASSAFAQDPDIEISERTRASEVRLHCKRLLLRSSKLTLDQQYHKALCLKFGISTEAQVDMAEKLLRDLAAQQHAPAQLALADTLQSGSIAEQREALHWYERGAAAGDSRAMARAARLSARLQSKAEVAETVQDSFTDGFNDPADSPPGYHCHRSFKGPPLCHGGFLN